MRIGRPSPNWRSAILMRGLHVAPDRGSDAVIHEIEGGQMADLLIAHGLRDFLKDSQHGAFADREIFPGEDAVLGKLLNGELEKIELIGMKGIKLAELIAAAPAVEVNGIVAKAVKRLQIVLLAIVNCGEDFRLLFLFWQGAAFE